MNLKERIMELYLGSQSLSLRYLGVAEMLESEPDETREALKELTNRKVMFKQSGYYQLNPYFLWEDENIKNKYKKRALADSK